MRKISIVLFSLFLAFTFLVPAAFAQGSGGPKVSSAESSGGPKAELNFFHSLTCPHCAKEKIFLVGLKQKYPSLVVNQYDVADAKNVDSLSDFYIKYNVPKDQQGMVPANFIGDKYLIGFSDQIGGELDSYVGQLISGSTADPINNPGNGQKDVTLPFIGRISLGHMSPMALSIILGALDGFNPCALVALSILLAFLVSTGMRQRVLLVGGTFIVVSAVVYFLFISAWFNLFMALSNIRIITVVIALITLVFAIFVLKEYFNDLICKLCDINGKESWLGLWQKKMFTKIANITMKQLSLPVLLIAVATVSAGINAIELVCSFGFPLAFTKILIAQNLSLPAYYFYLVIYIVFYCLLEFIIFMIAVVTMRATRVGDKYLQIAKLLSGIVLLALALIMLFLPGWLTF